MAEKNNAVDELYSFLGIENDEKKIKSSINLGSLNRTLNTRKPTALNCDQKQTWNNSVNMSK